RVFNGRRSLLWPRGVIPSAVVIVVSLHLLGKRADRAGRGVLLDRLVLFQVPTDKGFVVLRGYLFDRDRDIRALGSRQKVGVDQATLVQQVANLMCPVPVVTGKPLVR